jgi:cytochrome c-type biogenesis protein CcsB
MVLLAVALTGYAAAALLYWLRLAGRGERAFCYRGIALGVAVSCHVAILVRVGLDAGRAPMWNLSESFSIVALFMVVVFVFAEWRWGLAALGAVVLPLATGALLASTFYRPEVHLTPSLRSPWLPIHVGLTLASYAILSIALAAALTYLAQERLVRSRRLGGLSRRLPSMEAADLAGYRMVALGLPLLTMGIITGSIWAESAWGKYWHWDPKETASLITWLVFVAYLHARAASGWRGRRAAILIALGFCSILTTYLGVGLAGIGLHGGPH